MLRKNIAIIVLCRKYSICQGRGQLIQINLALLNATELQDVFFCLLNSMETESCSIPDTLEPQAPNCILRRLRSVHRVACGGSKKKVEAETLRRRCGQNETVHHTEERQIG